MNNILLEKVKSAVSQYNMLEPNCSVSVALSGGADSVVLLHALLELRTEFGIEVSACHVNHNLRGEESNRDEDFARRLCGELRIPLKVRSVDVAASKKKHQSTEEAAREARYAFFSELAGLSSPRFTAIATAHTASDNAETVLLNLFRGTGLKGLCGIPPVREYLVRPLILCERSEVEEFCRQRGLTFVSDSTNSSEEFTRNKIRLSLLPLIKQINPSFEDSITRMCKILREDSDFLEKSSEIGENYSVTYLKSLEKPLLSRIIKRLLSNNNISPTGLRVSQIIGIIESGKGKINLEKHQFALIRDGKLKIEKILQNYR
ncbi:MAG: tRNA lysidine(34) synthetase TilS [Oscillospiraceae bacterium]|nr:tRNA lysidine(34) synthetase TilS [Oscillospiraceae bacterium]